MHLVNAMFQAVQDSLDESRNKITNIKYSETGISFTFDGNLYESKLLGRNADLCLGFGIEQDKSIALRCLLDGHAKKQ